jgi:hypothetical protein
MEEWVIERKKGINYKEIPHLNETLNKEKIYEPPNLVNSCNSISTCQNLSNNLFHWFHSRPTK